MAMHSDDNDTSSPEASKSSSPFRKLSRAIGHLESFVRNPKKSAQGYGTFSGISLQQFLYDRGDYGRPKVKVAAR